MEGILEYGTVRLYYVVPEVGHAVSACYVHGTKEMAQRLAKVLEGRQTGVFAIEGEDWNADLSPWSAPAVFKGETDFAGGADVYLDLLCNRVIPQTEETLGLNVVRRGLMGYSLAGLFSVYAMYKTALFSEIASVSGSLWYDGFVEFMQERTVFCKPQKVYFSVGRKEKKTRNRRMAGVEECTLKAKARLEEEGISCLFEINEGNHFYQVEERMEKAAEYLF